MLSEAGDSEAIIREMQGQAMGLRMVEIGGIFSALKRIVRDYTSHSEKQITLSFQGGNVEIDKTIIDQLKGILTHVIRNSMDHGIETPEVRRNHGKSTTGSITVRAKHESGVVVIMVEDDGAGVDIEKIYAKALKSGLVAEEDELSHTDKLNLLFEAGLSTAEKVTNISGRGVGMDAVKTEIENLRGNISIQTADGNGSTFTIKLPMTLAIIDGMLIEASGYKFALPLLSIVESMRSQPEQIRYVKGHSEVVELRGEFIPLVRLHQLFNLKRPNSDASTDGLLVIVEEGCRKVCLFVDEIHGQNSIVIKDTESNFIKMDHISGATILGNGELAPIINVPSLFSNKMKRIKQ
jgi:two-component system, chemotaxis family, sensor kinase CheA